MSEEDVVGGGSAAVVEADAADRRGRQRFVARRHGQPCFWVTVATARFPLNDLSLDGFSASFPQPALAAVAPAGFDFVLHRDGVPDEVRGHAVVVNQVPGPDGPASGCRFVGLSEDAASRLHEWLVAHVIMSATVRITEKDAALIVQGRSLV